ncbi:hypothetical protein GCM10010981_32930 [Dyella nitratireducens]|uniref:Uncharacterized protein n=1 Tax=Dyella nitratireducens TaxID=1849580 RepID=A0ABQ1GCL8_9GAMM|nr:hypothetical protein GCM10010981_32930 [Dyella nitratireducens]GLQ40651.1 hypothetical protein GCM10007902_05000 [Dyella nitratireducens]
MGSLLPLLLQVEIEITLWEDFYDKASKTVGTGNVYVPVPRLRALIVCAVNATNDRARRCYNHQN